MQPNKLISLLKVKCEDSRQDIGDLSGGNQQKIVLARWLTDESQLLILDEPFQGVDISSRQEIGEILRKNTLNKASLIVCSDSTNSKSVSDISSLITDFYFKRFLINSMDFTGVGSIFDSIA